VVCAEAPDPAGDWTVEPEPSPPQPEITIAASSATASSGKIHFINLSKPAGAARLRVRKAPTGIEPV
jgi:hypothetical protein